MSGINLTGDKQVKEAFAKLDQAVQRGIIAKTAEAVRDYAEQQADTHTKDGALRRSVYLRSIQGGWEIGHDERMAPHAKFVHWGTKPHIIKPKKFPFPVYYTRKSKNGNVHAYRKERKTLRWVGGNGYVYAGEVHHPGYIGHPWLEHALERVVPVKFNQLLKQAVNSL